jgi:hypothetical protein
MLLLSRLCTSLLVNTPLPIEVPECTNQRLSEAHHIARPRQYLRFLRFTAPHRSRLNRESTTCLPHPLISSDGGPRSLCCSTLVSLRIRTARVLLCATTFRRRQRLQPALPRQPLRWMHATIWRLGWSGLASKHSEHSIQERVDGFWFALSLPFPERLLPQLLAHATATPASPHVSAAHLSMPATVTRPPC